MAEEKPSTPASASTDVGDQKIEAGEFEDEKKSGGNSYAVGSQRISGYSRNGLIFTRDYFHIPIVSAGF